MRFSTPKSQVSRQTAAVARECPSHLVRGKQRVVPLQGRRAWPVRKTIASSPITTHGSKSITVYAARSAETNPVDREELPQSDRALCISFSAAGLLFPYQVGSAVALRELGILQEDTVLAGCSAGALVAAFHHSGVPFEVVLARTKRLYRDLKKNGYAWRIESLLVDLLVEVLPEDCHRRCSGRMSVAVTQFRPLPQRPLAKLLTRWPSKQDLVEALVCSTFQPFYSGPRVGRDFRGGAWHCDGALTNFIPPPPDPSFQCFNVVPSPWWGADINPGIRGWGNMPYSYPQLVAMVFLPALYSDETVDHLYQLGYDDAVQWSRVHWD